MKLIKNIRRVLFILLLLIVLDIYSIYFHDKPIFIINVENGIYRGILYDTFYCEDKIFPKIIFKWNKYNCSLNEKIVNNEEEFIEKKATLTLVGDLLFETPYYEAIKDGEDKDKYFNLVKKYFLNDDLSIGNMEVVIGNNDMLVSGDGYNFCAPEYIGELVSTLDFEVLGTANNHAYDRGIEGIYSTIDYFKNNTSIKTIGTYKTKEERENFNVLDINGIKFGFLAYTYGTNQKPSYEDGKLISYFKDPYTKELTDEYKNILKKEVKNIRKECDVLIILMHWGDEFNYKPTNEQREMALFLNELKVDIIVGSHSHNIEPIELIGDKHKTLVYYSLGNFISHDNDIARTPLGDETYDNAYQVGMLSTINLELKNGELIFNNVESELIINFFDESMRNFELVPYKYYDDVYEKNHYRYNLGLTKDFIDNMYESVINEKYRIIR